MSGMDPALSERELLEAEVAALRARVEALRGALENLVGALTPPREPSAAGLVMLREAARAATRAVQVLASRTDQAISVLRFCVALRGHRSQCAAGRGTHLEPGSTSDLP